MTQSYFLKLVLVLGFSSSAIAQNDYTAFHFEGKQTYVVHNNELLQKAKKNTLKKVLDLNHKANASIISDNELWVGSNKGLQIYDLKSRELLRTKFQDTAIAGLTVDARGKVWVATTFKGVFAQNDQGIFDNKLNVMANYCITSTPDDQVYVGTNLGLYQIPINNEMNTVRYAEEAHSGHGLPDNLVENLYADASSNIWIMMPDNISFKKSDNSFGEIPSFAFVGDKQNKIYKILALNGDNYLFVTSNGVMLLPSASLQHHGRGDEVFSGQDANAVLLDAKTISKPKSLQNDVVLFAEKNKDRIYFYTANGIWDIKEKDVTGFVKKKKR